MDNANRRRLKREQIVKDRIYKKRMAKADKEVKRIVGNGYFTRVADVSLLSTDALMICKQMVWSTFSTDSISYMEAELFKRILERIEALEEKK